MIERPRLHLVAGPNGAGKSTYSREAFRRDFLLLDPDRFGIQSDATIAPVASGRAVVDRVRAALAGGESFVLETTLSGNFPLSVLKRARDRNYEITLLYIGIDDADECLRRIGLRVRAGGHPVPEHDVRRRLVRSIANLPAALRYADRVIIYDNGTGSEAYREVAVLFDGVLTVAAEPAWARSAVAELHRMVRNAAPQEDDSAPGKCPAPR
jgi:predicted ABC-type ATPase